MSYSIRHPSAFYKIGGSPLFRHPYTKIDYLVRDLSVTRKTASKYLDALVEIGLLSKHKIGKENFYLNGALMRLISGII